MAWRKVRPEKIEKVIKMLNDWKNWWKKYADTTIAQMVWVTVKSVKKIKEELDMREIEDKKDEDVKWFILWRQVTKEEETIEMSISILNREMKRIQVKQHRWEDLSPREIEVLEKVASWVFKRVQTKKEEENENVQYNIIKLEVLWNDEILKRMNIKPS